jgi:hypothetical protein
MFSVYRRQHQYYYYYTTATATTTTTTTSSSSSSSSNSIQFIYLSAWQQTDKAKYSQALKQQYRINNNNKRALRN